MVRTTLTDLDAIKAELQRRLAPERPPIGPCLTGNGTLLSVQASAFHYCSPRQDAGPYDTVEVLAVAGYPGRKLSSLLRSGPWRHDWSRPLGWVPVGSVALAIAADGGLVACV